jgi:hypothetical protein
MMECKVRCHPRVRQSILDGRTARQWDERGNTGDRLELDRWKTIAIGHVAEPETLTSRRAFMKLLGLGGALALVPGMLAACEDDDALTAPASGNAITIDFSNGGVAALQLASLLEQLQADFYTRVVNGFDGSDLTTADKAVLGDIRNHEVIHRDVIQNALGDAAFTLTPIYPGVSFTSRASVLATAKTLEELGVAAYNGVMPYFSTTTSGLNSLMLTAKIASVEARHASAIVDLLTPRAADFAPKASDKAMPPLEVAVAVERYIGNVFTLTNLL